MKNCLVHLKCPWCDKGEVIANGRAKIIISAQCPKCHKFFEGDLDNETTIKSKAYKRAS